MERPAEAPGGPSVGPCVKEYARSRCQPGGILRTGGCVRGDGDATRRSFNVNGVTAPAHGARCGEAMLRGRVDTLDELVSVVARLRGEGGCPWDRAQTLETLRPYVLEEAYEVV